VKKFLIVLVSLIVILVAVDRVGVVVANVALEGALRDRLHLDHKPKVRVHGIPFLTQIVGGKYSDIEVDASGLDADKLHNLDANVRLRGVHVPLSDLGRWDFSTIPIDHVKADVTVPYDELATAAGLSSMEFKADGGELDFAGPLTYAGHTIDVTGKASPSVSGGALQINPQQATVNGAPVPAAYLALLNKSISLTDLPFGIKVTSVQVTDKGLAGNGTIDHVTIRDGQLVPAS
jgi:hypothetical protein